MTGLLFVILEAPAHGQVPPSGSQYKPPTIIPPLPGAVIRYVRRASDAAKRGGVVGRYSRRFFPGYQVPRPPYVTAPTVDTPIMAAPKIRTAATTRVATSDARHNG
jgi:hypothetical protein